MVQLLIDLRSGKSLIWGGGVEPEGKRPIGRSGHRWEDNIKMDLQDLGWGLRTERGGRRF